jgi:hypothetical protein
VCTIDDSCFNGVCIGDSGLQRPATCGDSVQQQLCGR